VFKGHVPKLETMPQDLVRAGIVDLDERGGGWTCMRFGLPNVGTGKSDAAESRKMDSPVSAAERPPESEGAKDTPEQPEKPIRNPTPQDSPTGKPPEPEDLKKESALSKREEPGGPENCGYVPPLCVQGEKGELEVEFCEGSPEEDPF
jgi:hypothetical protein